MSNATLRDLYRSKDQIVDEMEAIYERAQEQGRKMTPDERREFDKLGDEAEEYVEEIRNRLFGDDDGSGVGERAFDNDDGIHDRGYGLNERSGAPAIHDNSESDQTMTNRNDRTLDLNPDQRRALDSFIREGTDSAETREAVQSIGAKVEGGAIGTTVLSDLLFDARSAMGGVRDVARVFRTEDGSDMNVPGIDDSDSRAEIVAENSTRTGTVAKLDFSDVQFTAHRYMAGPVTLSVEQIQDSRQNVVDIVTRKLGRRMRRATNEDYAASTATSSTAPNGIIAANGSTGSRTMVAGSSNLTLDLLRDLKFDVDREYREGGIYLMGDDSWNAALSLSDADNRPILQPTPDGPFPGQIFGHDVVVDPDLPSIENSSNKPIFFGRPDIGYGIREVQTMRLRRIENDFDLARSGRVAFLAAGRFDAKPLFSSTIGSTLRPYRAIKTTT